MKQTRQNGLVPKRSVRRKMSSKRDGAESQYTFRANILGQN
jgi:hypothetical protein